MTMQRYSIIARNLDTGATARAETYAKFDTFAAVDAVTFAEGLWPGADYVADAKRDGACRRKPGRVLATIYTKEGRYHG